MTDPNVKRRRKPFIRQFFHGNYVNLSLSILSSLITVIVNLVLSWLIQQLVDLSTGAAASFGLSQLIIMSLGLLGMLIVDYLIAIYASPRFHSRAMSQYKNYVFSRLSNKSISAFSRENSALYLSALSNDANTIDTDYLTVIGDLIQNVGLFFGSLVMMLWYSPMLTLAAVGLTLLPVIASMLTGNRMAKAEETVSNRNESFMSSLKDSLTGFSVVKSFRAEAAMCRLMAASIQDAEDAKRTRRKIELLIQCLATCSGVLAQFGVFIFGAYLALTGKGVTPGVVMVFVQLMNFVISPIGTVPQILAKRKAAMALIDKLASALAENVADQGQTAASLTDAIELEDVSFGYDEGKNVLRHISTQFRAGKSYAIVGASGSGKSTLLNLLMAGQAGYEGHIRFDGTELRDIQTDSLYDLVSLVQQNVFVFNATLRDNVTMFQPFPDEEVTRAMELSGLAELVKEKGEGYLCGENGSGLSGGEKQRLSIARSLLRKSPVLLMDEATAALDAQTASTVINAVLDLNGLTRIVVTHTLDEKVLRRYDAILTMKDGALLETGTFESLMAEKGYFYSLFTVSQ